MLSINQIRSKLNNNIELKKIISNTSWLFADRLLRMMSSLIFGVWMARYLGPSNFGILNYIISFVSLFFSLATLGLDNIIVHRLVKDSENYKAILGTVFIFQIFGGLLAYTLLVGIINVVNEDQGNLILMTSIYGFILIFKAFEVFKFWFEAKLQSKLTVWVENTVYFIFVAIKTILITNGATLSLLVNVMLIEVIISAIGLAIVYMVKYESIKLWKVNFKEGLFFLKESWPFVISGIAVVIYTRIDAVMLGQMLGNSSVGIYSVALRISEIWYFIPMTIVASTFPSIIEAKQRSEQSYIYKFEKLFRILFIIALGLALLTTFFAHFAIRFLYGSEYIESAGVLVLQTWSGVFVFLGVAGGRWFLAENLQRLLIYRTVLGATTNIVLNILLIPKFGVYGAAMATLASQAIANVFSNFIGKKSRQLFNMQVKSMLWLFRFKLT